MFERFFISLYRFFEKKRVLLFTLMVVSAGIFVYFGLQIKYEENIVKLLPQTGTAAQSGLAFEDLRVKDKIFIQITGRNGRIDTDSLGVYCDTFVQSLTEKDTASHYIANILHRVDDNLTVNALDFALGHVPSFVDSSSYPRFDSLLTIDRLYAQMAANDSLISEDEEGNITMMVSQDPAALRKALLPQGQSFAEGLNGFSIINGSFFSPDSTVALAFLAPNFSSFDSMSGIELVSLLEEEIESFETIHPEIEVLFHGNPVQSVFNSRQIREDLVLTIGISLIIISLVIGFCYRSKSTILLLLSPVAYGTFFSLACVYWIQGGMSLMAVGIGAIVLGIALSYCLHVLTHFKYISDPVKLLHDQAKPVCLGCLTTIGAFLALLFTESELLKDFGLFASLAMVGTTLFSLIFLPHFFPYCRRKRSEAAFRLLDRINSYPIDRNKPLRFFIVVACIITFLTSTWVTFDSNLRNIGYNEDKVMRSNLLYSEKNNHGMVSMYYAANGATLDEALSANKRIIAVLDSLQQAESVCSYTKTTQLFIPTAEQEQRIERWKEYWTSERIDKVRADITKAAKAQGLDSDIFEPFYIMLEADYESESLYDAEVFPESMLSNFIEKTAGGYMVFISVLMPEEMKQKVNDAIAVLPHAVVIDPFYYTGDMVELLNRDFNIILNISSIFVFIILLLSFRSISCAILAFIPMGVSWFVVQGVMGLCGLQFNLINIIIATFIFGVGVDYSIFVMSGLIAKARGEDEQLLTYHKTAIFFSALILIVVIGSLLFASHPALHSVGVSTLIGMSATILLTYAIQPALFRFLLRFRFFRRRFGRQE